MKKKLVTIVLISVLLLVAGYVLRYKLSLNFSERVPSTATEIVHVNVRKLEQQLVTDFVKNPFAYIRLKTAKRNRKRSFLKEIHIPKNILFFKNDSNFKDAWYSSLIHVKDSSSFAMFLVDENFKKTVYPDLTVFNKRNVSVVLKGNRLIIVFQYAKQADVLNAAISIFKETDFLPKTASVFATLTNAKGVMCYVGSSATYLEANFKKGVFELHGVLASDLFKSEIQIQQSDSAIAGMSFELNKKSKSFSTIKQYVNTTMFNDITHLSADSIFNKWSGAVNFKLLSINSKLDTIVSYDYDDDFNKVEKVHTQQVVQPNFSLLMKSENNKLLFDYLLEERAVQVVGSDTLLVSVPWYKIYAQSLKNGLFVSTNKNIAIAVRKKSTLKLVAFFNIEKYLKNQLEFFQFPTDNKVMKQLETVSVQLTEENNLMVKVAVKNKNRNSLGQFIAPN